MAKDAASLERLLHSLKPKDLHGVSRTVLKGLHDKIGTALSAKDDEEESKKPMSAMGHDQFEKFAAHLMAAKGEDV